MNLLNLIGTGYVIDHCISCFHKEQKKKLHDVYVTDVLRLISENTAKTVGGSYMKVRYLDLIDPKKEETRTANEVIDNIRNKLKGI